MLEQHHIIQIDHTYFHFPKQQKTGRSKRYKFNPDLIYTDAAIVQYDHTAKQFEDTPIIKSTVAILRRLKLQINKRDLKKYVFHKVTFDNIRKNRIRINKELPEDAFFLKGQQIPLSTKKLLALAQEQNKDLILYKDKCYIVDATTFRRLDTNLTNIFSDAISLLTLNNEALAQIDLSNSQFTILASLLEQNVKQAKTWTKASFNVHIKNEKWTDSGKVSDKKIKNVVVDLNYFNNCIIMLLTKNTKTADNSLIFKDLNDFFINTKSGIFYELGKTTIADTLRVSRILQHSKKPYVNNVHVLLLTQWGD